MLAPLVLWAVVVIAFNAIAYNVLGQHKVLVSNAAGAMTMEYLQSRIRTEANELALLPINATAAQQQYFSHRCVHYRACFVWKDLHQL